MIEVLGIITARGGSKGIPGKNVKFLAGKPLIAWTIEAALASRELSQVIVSTDDDNIAAVARKWGATVPFKRPARLAEDMSTHVSVIEHALEWITQRDGRAPEYFLVLQPTSPLRTAEDIDGAISLASKCQARGVVSVCEPSHHPYALKLISPEGTMREYVPGVTNVLRQDFPSVYAVNGALYICQSAAFLMEHTLELAGALPYIMPPERSFDIDSLFDFAIAEHFINHSF